MLSLVLVHLVLWVSLTLLLAAGTLFLQGYFYETPPTLEELAWRAPVAGTALTLFVALWSFLAYRSPEGYASLTQFSAREDRPPFEKLTAVFPYEKREYELRKDSRGRPHYVDQRGRGLPGRPHAVIVEEGGEKVTFRAEKDPAGKFKVERGQNLRYHDDRGRYMEEGYLGQLTTFHRGRWVRYLLLNLTHGAVWFACLWPVMRFTRGQALVMALACWAAMTLLVMPPVLRQVRAVAERRSEPGAAARPAARADRGEGKAKGEGLDDPPPCLSVSRAEPGSPDAARLGPPAAHGDFGEGAPYGYFAATDAVENSMATAVSWPARTVTSSVLLTGLPSRVISAFSV